MGQTHRVPHDGYVTTTRKGLRLEPRCALCQWFHGIRPQEVAAGEAVEVPRGCCHFYPHLTDRTCPHVKSIDWCWEFQPRTETQTEPH
jgi:hypothetical protein